MIIHNNIMYYHAGTSSDEVSRLNVTNAATLSNLDVGARVGENGGDIVSMELSGDTLMISVVSGQWWNSDGSGGIARWNTTTSTWEGNILPTGSIDRVTAYESSNGNTWVSWGELKLDLYDSSRNLVNSWTDLGFPIRGIVEHNGETLFATEDGVERYNENTNAWNSTWEAGNGLPSNAGDIFYELWTDGTHLVVGGADFNGFGQFREGIISHRNGAGAWTSYPADSNNNIPDGYPMSMEMCGGMLNIAMYNNNGGIARLDLQNATVNAGFDRSQLDGTAPASVTCDSQDTLYIGYYTDNQPISRYSYATTAFLSSLTTSSHNLPSDRVWYDALSHSGTQLIVGHAVGNSGPNLIAGGFSTWSPAAPLLCRRRSKVQVHRSPPCSGSVAPLNGSLAVPVALRATAKLPPCRPPGGKRSSTFPASSAVKCPRWWPTLRTFGPPLERLPPQETLAARAPVCSREPSCLTEQWTGNTVGPSPATRWPTISTCKGRTSSSPPTPEACSNSTPPPAPSRRWAARFTASSTRCTPTTVNSLLGLLATEESPRRSNVQPVDLSVW